MNNRSPRFLLRYYRYCIMIKGKLSKYTHHIITFHIIVFNSCRTVCRFLYLRSITFLHHYTSTYNDWKVLWKIMARYGKNLRKYSCISFNQILIAMIIWDGPLKNVWIFYDLFESQKLKCSTTILWKNFNFFHFMMSDYSKISWFHWNFSASLTMKKCILYRQNIYNSGFVS